MKSAMVALFILAFVVAGFSQDYEYGNPSELKGLKKILIDTGPDIKNRNRIVEELEKANLGFQFVDSADDAEIIMSFGGSRVEIVSGATTTPVYGTNNTTTTVNRRKVATGSGYVFIKGIKKLRVVMSFESTQDKFFEKKPATKLAKEFIKAYEKANEDG